MMPMPVIIGNGNLKTFDVDMYSQDIKATAEYVYRVIRDMTYLHLERTECKVIEKQIKNNVPSFVYFGDFNLLAEDKPLNHLNWVASFDKERNPTEPVKFYFNTDQAC